MPFIYRRFHIRTLLVQLVLFLSVISSSAQTHFRNYTVKDGLSNNTVKAMTFDSYGLLWIGTEDGLNLFDGRNFHHVTNFVSDEYRNYNDYVESLYTDSEGTLWLGSNNGVYTKTADDYIFYPLDITTEDGKSVTSMVYSITEDSRKRIWIGTYNQGIFCYDLVNKTLANYTLTNDNESFRYIPYVYVDSNDKVWAAVRSYSYYLMSYDDVNDCFYFYDKESSFPEIMCICEDHKGNLWFGTWDSGIVKYNPRSKKKEVYFNDPARMFHAHSIIEYKDGVIAVGSDRGLCLWDDNTGEATVYNHLESSNYSLSNDYIYPLILDKEGGLWIGTYYGGVNYLSPLSENIYHYEYQNDGNSVNGNIISVICEDKYNRIWIGSDDGGVDCYDPKTRTFIPIPGKGYDWFSNLNVHALCADNDDLWIGTYDGGLHRYNMQTGAISTYRNTAPPDYEDCSSAYSIYKDSKGVIWIGSMYGILSYDREMDSIVSRLLVDTVIMDIEEDLHGNIWFATQNAGLYCYETNSGQFFNFTINSHGLPSDQINNIFVNTGDEILIGTSKGIVSYSHSKKEFSLIDAVLLSDNICYIQRSQNLIWVSTTTGLAYYNIEEDKWYNFSSVNDGTKGSYLISSGLISTDNELYLGTTRGLDVISLTNISNNKIEPEISIFSISSRGETKFRPEQMAKIVEEGQTVVFKSKEHNITFRLYSSSMVNPSRNVFHYTLEGYDEVWNNTTESFVTYSKIPPGKYTFKFTGSNSDGVLSNEVISLDIKVKAPLLFSTFFNIIYTLLILSLVTFFVWTYFRNKERKRIDRIVDLQRNSEVETYQEKLNFFTMIAHEIKTPASLILAPLESALELEQSDQMRKYLNVIKKNCRSLMDLISQLLDYKKVENGGFAINKTTFNLYETIATTLDNYKFTAQSKQISFEQEIKVSKDFNVYMDRGALEKILNNLLTNALKYCKSSIKFTCEYNDARDEFVISIKDDGIGIAESNIHNIFKPFFREDEFNQLGTGIGLYLVKYLVESHNGQIIVDSQKGNGSEFVVTLPANSDIIAKEADAKAGSTKETDEISEPSHKEEKIQDYLSLYEENEIFNLNNEDPFWQKLNHFMEKNIDNPDYSANQLAEDVGVSRTKLFSYFKEVSDMTPMELMQYCRLKKAASLLISGEHRISEVAYMVGFKDPSYFTKCFTKQFGMKPIVFIQKAREKGV